MVFWELVERIQKLFFDWVMIIFNYVLRLNYSFKGILCDPHLSIAEKCHRIEFLLISSQNSNLKALNWKTGTEIEEAEAILKTKARGEQGTDLRKQLADILRKLKGYKELKEEVENLRSVAYDSGNSDHEKLLMELWGLLKPYEELTSRKSRQWEDIGFQGDDPATDFRGMGILGLQQLVYYAQLDPKNCEKVFNVSLNPIYGFPFAICGITITALCKQLLDSEALKNHFANSVTDRPTIEDFNRLYCLIFNLFGKFWAERKPENLMVFNELRNEFVSRLQNCLTKTTANMETTTLQSLNAVDYRPAAIPVY